MTAQAVSLRLPSAATPAFEVALTRLRADQAVGTLPSVAMALNDRVTRTMQGLAAG